MDTKLKAASVSAVGSLLDRFAHAVAYVINPLILPPVLFGALLLEVEASAAEVGVAILIAFVLMTILPLAYLGWMVKTGRAASLYTVAQAERAGLFIFGILCALASIALLYAVLETGRILIISVASCIVASAVLLALINRQWKISIHATAAAGFVSVLLFASYLAPSGLSDPYAAWLIPVAPLVMWARVRTGAHRVSEVVAGAGLGVAVPVVVLSALEVAGFF